MTIIKQEDFIQSIANELVERHHHRHRVPRQSEEVGGADLAVGEGTARLHRDLPEHHFAQLVEQRFDEIGFAYGDAAAAASLNAFSSSAGSSRTTPMSSTSQPRRVSMPWRV